jgi:hypothetical protein
VRRPRRAGAELNEPEPLPQSWVPRVMNGAVGVLFLVLLAPVVRTWGDRQTSVRVGIVLFGTPFLLVAVMALASAVRPGSVARFARRLRRRR